MERGYCVGFGKYYYICCIENNAKKFKSEYDNKDNIQMM